MNKTFKILSIVGNLSIKISIKVFEKKKFFIQGESHKIEAGGILIGYYLDDNKFSINDDTLPCKFDKQSRFNFTRSKKNAQDIINKIFKENHGTKFI